MSGTNAWNRLRYTLYAPIYDFALARVPVFARGRRRAIELAALEPGERVLVVACGTGLDLPLLPAHVHVAAVDLTPAMVARFRARADRLGRTVHARVMDAAHLQYHDDSFDCVLLHLALAVVPDPVRVAQEAARVLRPRGRVSIFDKFLPPGRRPSAARRVVSAVSDVVASDLNRELEPILAAARLRLTAYEPVGIGGNFVAARAEPLPAADGARAA